jgi:hypothetical protein
MATSTTTDDDTVEYDENGDPIKKKASTVATQDASDSDSTVALSDEALSGGAATDTSKTASDGTDTTQANTDVLAAAQNSVLDTGTDETELQKATDASTLNWVNNPEGDYDPDAYRQAQLDAANADYAKTFEALRQQYGNTSGSGLTQATMLSNALQHNTDMQSLESDINTENYNKYIDSLSKSIAAGESVSKNDADIYSEAIGNLSTVRSMDEGEREQDTAYTYSEDLAAQGFDYDTQLAAQQQGYDLETLSTTYGYDTAKMILQSNLDTESQTTLKELQAKIDSDTLMTTEDFTATQNELDRELELAKQKNDEDSTTALTELKAQLDQTAQDKQNEYETTLTQATQAWTTNERISTEDYEAQQNALQIAADAAAKDKDIAEQKYVADQQTALELQLKTQDMAQEEKMAYINAEIAEAKANNDTAREEAVIAYQTTQDITELAAKSGYDTAAAKLQAQLDEAVANNNAANTLALTKVQNEFTASEAEKDRVLKEQEIALEGKTIELNGQELTFNELETAITDGQISSDAATELLQSTCESYGISIEPADEDAAKKQVDKDYETQLEEYLTTHPKYATTDANGDTTLSDEGVAAYNAYVNSTVYGTDGTASDTITKIESGEVSVNTLRGTSGTTKYSDLLGAAKVVKDQTNTSASFLDGIPDKGTLVNIDGKLYQVGSSGTLRKDGRDGIEFYWVTDVNTGKQMKYIASIYGLQG